MRLASVDWMSTDTKGIRIVLLAGARPNFVKIAPIIRAIRRSCYPVEHMLVHSGQHYDFEMSEVFFRDLAIPKPDYHLGIGSGTHAEQTGRTMIEMEKVLVKEKPDLLVVLGDVNASLAGALAAAKLGISVAHVEAGVRCHDRSMPEEVNRLLTDHLSDYLFTASHHDDENLLREGVSTAKIFRVGNIIADSLHFSSEPAGRSVVMSRLGVRKRGYALVTLHRSGNVDDRDRLTRILRAIAGVSQRIPVVFPVHPRTRRNIDAFGLVGMCDRPDNHFILTEPLGYIDFLNLEMNAMMAITDSGGIQVETTVLGIPCLTILDSAIWPITHEQGTNRLVGSQAERLEETALQVCSGETREATVPELWDGKTADRIVDVLARSCRRAEERLS